jgi:hypothetical protein
VQARLSDDIHAPTQQFLRIQQKAAQGKGAGPRGKRYQKVHVAGVVGIAATHRPENPNTVTPRL